MWAGAVFSKTSGQWHKALAIHCMDPPYTPFTTIQGHFPQSYPANPLLNGDCCGWVICCANTIHLSILYISFSMFRTFIDLFIVGQPIITFTALLDPTLEVSESSQPERTPARQSWSHSGISFQAIVTSRLASRKRLWLTIHMEEDSNLHGRHQNMKKLLLAFLMFSWTALATWPSSPIHQQPRYVPSLINRHKYAINTTLTFYKKKVADLSFENAITSRLPTFTLYVLKQYLIQTENQILKWKYCWQEYSSGFQITW